MQFLITLQLQLLYTAYVTPQLEVKLKMFLRITLKLSLILGLIIILTFCVTKDNAGVVLRNFKSRRMMMEEMEAQENAAKADLQQKISSNKIEKDPPLLEPNIQKLNVTSISTNNSNLTNLTQTKKRPQQPKKPKKKSNFLKLQKTPETKLSKDTLKSVIPKPVDKAVQINFTNNTIESNSSSFVSDEHILNDSIYVSSTKSKDSDKILKFESTVNHLENATSGVEPLTGNKPEHALSETDHAELGQIDKLSEEDLRILENDPCFLANKNYSQETEGEFASGKFCPETVYDVLDIDDAVVEDVSSKTNLTLVNEFLRELESELNETTEIKVPHNVHAPNRNMFNVSLNRIEDIGVSNDGFVENVPAENKSSQKKTLHELNSGENAGRNLTETIPEHEIIHLEPEPEINEGIVRPESKENESDISQNEVDSADDKLGRNLTTTIPEHEIIHLEPEPEINEGIVRPGNKENESDISQREVDNVDDKLGRNLTETIPESEIIHLEPEPDINEGIVKSENDSNTTDSELNTLGETDKISNLRNLTADTSNVVEQEIIHLEPDPEINEGIMKPGNDNKSADINTSKEALDGNFNESQENDTGLGIEFVVASGIDFIMNTEVAKNAAMAMEVFNLTDSSLTDHVIEDNDMHSLIDIILPNTPEEFKDDGIETSETGSLTTGNKTLQQSSILNSKFPVENATLLTNFNITSNVTQNFSVLNLLENKNVIDLTTNLSNSAKAKECPPPGICIFWFTSSDLCSDSSDCPGEQICCTVRCSKDCVDV